MRNLLIAAAAIGVAFPNALSAQQTQQATQAQQGIVVVSSSKCKFDKLTEVNNWMRQTGAPILNDLVKQGRLINWGTLMHMWGDEWNSVTYYSARDLNTFSAAFSEFFRRAMQADPTTMQRISEWCTEHKDNIYTTVVSSPPSQ